jgi:CrcB protein
MSRALHWHPGYLAAVFLGGAVGSLSRHGLGLVLPTPDGWPLSTLIINLAGAFLLGVLLDALLRQGPDAGRLRVARLVFGTGFLGAFTTYSALALEAVTLAGSHGPAALVLYVLVSVLLGITCAAAGVRVAGAVR